MPTSHKPQVFCKQGFRVTKAIFCLLGKSPLRSGPRKTEVHRTSCAPIPIERCLRHRAAASPVHSGPRKADVHRTSCARSGCFNGSSCQRKRRSESSPRLQKRFTCACGLHAFCSPRLYAFSSLRSAGHCTGQS